jgi:hypothetical protein
MYPYTYTSKVQVIRRNERQGNKHRLTNLTVYHTSGKKVTFYFAKYYIMGNDLLTGQIHQPYQLCICPGSVAK